MFLSDLLNKKISKIRFNHEYDNQRGMQRFQSQIKLSTGEFILLPNSPDNDHDLIVHYQKNKASSFQKAKRCGLASRLLFRNKTIVDIHIRYFENEPLVAEAVILELDNGKFITENNFGPQGITTIDLMIMNKSQFLDFVDEEIEIRSFRNDILKN